VDSLNSIRDQFAAKLAAEDFLGGTIEIVGATFVADNQTIFGEPNQDYIDRELEWYLSESLCVDDIPGETPKIWKQISSDRGLINSNYGNLMLSSANGSQLENVITHLLEDRETRRATAIYTRPSIHTEWNVDGMADFICTNAVQYLIRNDELQVVVQMRSNDAVFGYRNDYAWQRYMQEVVVRMLSSNGIDVKPGRITWNVGSLHIYQRHFWLVEQYAKTGEFNVSMS
jgi:thymidylate synthase